MLARGGDGKVANDKVLHRDVGNAATPHDADAGTGAVANHAVGDQRAAVAVALGEIGRRAGIGQVVILILAVLRYPVSWRVSLL